MSIKGKDLIKVGWEPGPIIKTALDVAAKAQEEGRRKRAVLNDLTRIRVNPERYLEDPVFAELAEFCQKQKSNNNALDAAKGFFPLAETPVDYTIWGADALDEGTLKQLDVACRLPKAAAGALMPDGHIGYGLPIGGVLATRGVVIPYAVGVDIACRMKLSVTNIPMSRYDGMVDKLRQSIVEQTSFGMGANFNKHSRRDHDVMDDPAWDELPRELRRLRDKAWSQLGSSGGGNHFVEFGEFIVDESEDAPANQCKRKRLEANPLGLEPGARLTLLSHSGSRGFGAQVAAYFTKIAMDITRLPKEARHLAWLDLETEPGRQYWTAMNLAGRYAQANHDLIHRHVLKAAGVKPSLQIDNHHNFAWKETHNGEEVIVHRKGATPAGDGVLGIIPGSMGDPGFVVRGKGDPKSLCSASHGAGRKMSRRQAVSTLTKSSQAAYLEKRGVELISGGLDEAPMAYKNIHQVMAAQEDLVEILGEFRPRLVKMAND